MLIKKYLAISVFLLCFAGISNVNATVVAGDLKCENLTDPLAIDNIHPRFSWKLIGGKIATDQKYYHIQVASDISLLENGTPDLWDSGKIKSRERVMVPYGGRELKSRSFCYWRVMVWNDKGEVSGWSRIAHFGVGLIDSEEIKGSFIGYPSSGATSPILRRKFRADEAGISLLHVNSLGYHEVYINGRKVGEEVLSPAVSQLDKRSLYVTYDVAPYLKKGENELVVWLGQGWYRKNAFGKWTENDPYDEPLVRAQLDQLAGDGWKTICQTDANWETRLSGYTGIGSWNALDFGGEKVDARLNPVDLRSETLDKLSWQPVITAKKPGHQASPQMCQPNKIMETLHPVEIKDAGDGAWIVDMGKVINGWFELRMQGVVSGSEITIEYSDEIDKEGGLQDQKQEDTYIARGGGEERFCNKFNYHAFRYVKIDGLPAKPEKKDINGHLIHTDYDAASSFECSDTDLNAIHDMIQYTMLCLAYSGYMVDCPHLERAGYGGDGNSSNEILQTMYDVAPLYANWLQAWGDTMRPGGSLPHVAPNHGTNGGGPYWCGFIIMAPWQTYVNYGDRSLIERHYPAMQEWLGYVNTYTLDGLLTRWPDTEYRDWFLGDWLAPDGVDTGNEASISLVNNCFISDCYATMEKIADILGKPEDAKLYAEKRKTLNELLHKTYFNSEENTYATASQLDMTYPMLVGVTPLSNYKEVEKQLFAETEAKMDGHIGGGLVGIPIITKWAIENRAAEWIYTMLKKRDYPGYLYMIDNGATTTWEYWNGERSRVHNCYNGIGTWFYQAVGGLRSDENKPGYNHLFIDPQIPEGITWSRVTKETSYGTVKLDWNLESSLLKINLSLPVGTTGTVIIPENAVRGEVNGKRFGINKNKVLKSGTHEITFFLR